MAPAGFGAGFGTPIPAPGPSSLPRHPPPYPPPGIELHQTRTRSGLPDPSGTHLAGPWQQRDANLQEIGAHFGRHKTGAGRSTARWRSTGGEGPRAAALPSARWLSTGGEGARVVAGAGRGGAALEERRLAWWRLIRRPAAQHRSGRGVWGGRRPVGAWEGALVSGGACEPGRGWL
jgi:hypothetical protein